MTHTKKKLKSLCLNISSGHLAIMKRPSRQWRFLTGVVNHHNHTKSNNFFYHFNLSLKRIYEFLPFLKLLQFTPTVIPIIELIIIVTVILLIGERKNGFLAEATAVTIVTTATANNSGPILIVNLDENNMNNNNNNNNQNNTGIISNNNTSDNSNQNRSDYNNLSNNSDFRPLQNHSEIHGNVGKVKKNIHLNSNFNNYRTNTVINETIIATTTDATITTSLVNNIFGNYDIKINNLTVKYNDFNRFKKPFNYNTSLSKILVNRRFKVNEVFEKERKYKSLSRSSSNGNKIVLLGLFELSTKMGSRPEGLSELGAAQMAVQHINKKKLLPGYTLELLTNDTECDPGVGVDRFFHALYTQNSTRMVMLLGSACSEVTESLAKVVPYWNIVQVSFGSTSPALSDRHEFPFFYRTVAPDSSHNPARIAFIRKFGWDTVTTFSQNEEVHSLAVNDLVTELESSNISCAATITFAETDFKDQLLLLRDLDTRIIIGSFSQELAPKIFCEAYKLGMFGADYAWILHESMGPPWSNNNNHNNHNNNNNNKIYPLLNEDCNHGQLMEALENLIIVSSHNSIVGNKIGLSGLNNHMFMNELNHMKVPEPMSRYAPQTYDAVWAIALALRGAEDHWRRHEAENKSKLFNFDYTRYDMATEFLQQMGKLDFLGVSGPVSFSGPDRIGTTAFYQIQNGILQPVALYYPAEHNLDFNCPKCENIKWHSGQVPIAKRIFKVRISTIAPLAFYTIAILSIFGITLSIAFLAFNLHFRKLKAIKLSSPKLSNITAFGCILVYTAVILLGLDYSTLASSENLFSSVCTARVYLLSAGFSLAFGSMFAKTYRVHRIFTRAGSGVCKDKMLQDTQLISLVCALLILDCLVVTLWIFTDPIERHLNNLTLEISTTDRSVVYQPQVEVCRSQHTESWLGALYAYKGLLLIVGVYMAWETRHVKIPALNDSQYIGVSVYSVVITSALVVVLANLISERVTLAFITITALILASTTATLCLLFIPKLHDIWARNDVVDPVIHSMGLKMEYNTRRFVIDDKRELQYRVEVQNRVYKKEILALDAEINRLEKLLDSNSVSSSSNISITVHPKSEITVMTETATIPKLPQQPLPRHSITSKSRTPSITGGLPYLLLSVLPPVIPRASWPSAEYMQIPMRRSVTFASQPQLEDSRSINEVCLPAADLFNLRLAHQQATETKGGIINRIRGIFSRHSSSNKGSSGSLSNRGNQIGLKAAFKSHMGMFSRLIPNSETASCNALYNKTNTLNPFEKTQVFAKSSTDLDRTVIDPNFLTKEPTTVDDEIGKYVKTSHTKVNFQLPLDRRTSITVAPPTLRERTKGSPRFPHRILPTSSLSALEEQETPELTTQRPKIKLEHISGISNWKSMEMSHSRFSIDDDNQINNVIEQSPDHIYVLPDPETT